MIYNKYSAEAQIFVKDTRFETPEGKIYRIDRAVTVPGMKNSGGQTVAGSVEATVYADKSGSEYNIGFSDFTIPGLKGGLKYEKFYARSKTPMTGGMKGTVPDISEGGQCR